MRSLVLYLAPWAFAALPFLFICWLMQPTVQANPGLGGYKAPPATALEPFARRPQSSEPPIVPSLATNFAEDYSRERGPELQAPTPDRKRSRPAHTRKYREPAYAYAQAWNGHRQRKVRR
jgi:hypothetical protein